MLFTISVVGEEKTGKTSWITRMNTGDFTEKYTTYDVCTTDPVVFNTNYGKITINFRDIPNDEEVNKNLIGSDGVIVFRNRSDKVSSVEKYTDSYTQTYVTSFHDTHEKFDDLDYKSIKFPFSQISAKSNYNFEKPVISLLRLITKNDDLTHI